MFSLSLDQLKDIFLHELTISHVATVYVLIYVIYKALGRYIYFKPQEHASKINRTFVTLSLLVIVLDTFSYVVGFFPIRTEYRWLYAATSLVLLIAPLSILMDWIIWKYDEFGYRESRDWHYRRLRIEKDYYKTSIPKEIRNGHAVSSWEEEGVKSTSRNIHSDVLLNLLAAAAFMCVSARWAITSAADYGAYSILFFAAVSLPVAAIFIDSSAFSWIDHLAFRVKSKFQAAMQHVRALLKTR